MSRLRVTTVLALVVAVPVCALGWFTISDGLEARHQRTLAEQVRDATGSLAELVVDNGDLTVYAAEIAENVTVIEQGSIGLAGRGLMIRGHQSLTTAVTLDGVGRAYIEVLRNAATVDDPVARQGLLIELSELRGRWQELNERLTELDDRIMMQVPLPMMLAGTEPTAADIASVEAVLGLHRARLVAAVADVRSEAVTLADEVTTRANRAAAARATVMTITLGAVWVASRMITRPVGRLGAAAEALRDGRLDEVTGEDLAHGPTEIRALGTAIVEAATSVRLVEAQAVAIAAGQLDDPALSTVAPGRLGASLQDAVVSLARSLSEREDYRLRLSHEASHDALTGLVNRAALRDHLGGALARARRTRTSLAVVSLDLHGFKAVNEAFGHETGDLVLQRVGDLLTGAVRPDDLVARLGADEFAVIAEDVGTPRDAYLLAERLVAALAVPIDAGGARHLLTASAGVRVCTPDDPTHRLTTADAVAEVLRDVDAAHERSKAAGGQPVEMFTPDLQRELRERLDLENALRRALVTDGELRLLYQPVVDAQSGEPVGAEALMRWERPGVGIVSPDLFIAVAERSDLILEIDRWVVEQVAQQLAVWAAAGVLADRWVAVNVSGAHVCRPDVVPVVLGALARAGVDPRHLVVEITERELLADVELAAEHLRQLRTAGVKIAIDDFGTGFTSLTHLRWLPIDKLKIDQSFVRNLESADDESLVRLVIEIGHVLGVQVTAEGVETVEHLEALRALGADQVQGYLTGRPEAPVRRPVPDRAPQP